MDVLTANKTQLKYLNLATLLLELRAREMDAHVQSTEPTYYRFYRHIVALEVTIISWVNWGHKWSAHDQQETIGVWVLKGQRLPRKCPTACLNC